jgi:nicotinamidase-related amidase
MRAKSKTALLIIDMLNTLKFPGAKKLLRQAIPAARAIAKLKEKAKRKGIPVLYVNDNFGQWRSDWKAVFEICSRPDSLGHKLAEILKPDEDDYFVLKPRHSGFYSTTLDLLLRELGVKTLILTGVAGNICVLFTAHEAHMRGYSVIVPPDCIASNSRRENNNALAQMQAAIGPMNKSSRQLRLSGAR